MEWWSGGVVEWWSGGVVEWWSGGVVEWWSGDRERLTLTRLTLVPAEKNIDANRVGIVDLESRRA
jgi:hypothetical protein